MRLLVVEDEPKLGIFLTENLTREGHAVDLACSLEEAFTLTSTNTYALVLLDLRLPDGNGLQFLRTGSRGSAPVIILTAADALQDRVSGLNAGADDYICKPFAHEELMARINAVLRRPGQALGLTLRVGAIEFDTVSRAAMINGQAMRLPRRELNALELLMRAEGRVVMREALETALYTMDDEPSSNAIEANISRLRRRLKDLDSRVEIQVARGLGYILTSTEKVPA